MEESTTERDIDGVFVPIHERIARQAAAHPDAPAVTCNGASISYAQLEQRAESVAAQLRVLAGGGRDPLVAVALDRSIEMVVALLGVLKAGAAYLPIDLAYPRSRLEFVLEDARPVAILSSTAAQAQLPPTTLPVVLVDQVQQAATATSRPPARLDSDALAYVIYTSGSTGTPKGCLVTHGNVARLFDATQAWYGFDNHDVWTFFHSHAFDFSVWEIWGALVYGGRVVVVPQEQTRAPAEFLDLLVREGVTVLNQTPSAFRTLIDADGQGLHPASSLKLRYVIFGGEALELQMLRPWFDRHGDAQPSLVNMYGITETTVHVSYRPIREGDVAEGRGSVIGQAIPDLRIDLVDAAMAPVADGEPGEILVSGAGVSRGYLRRDELTAQRFIDWRDPASGEVLRAYRSGDLARRLPDGDLEYMGRIDQQVKIRGFRIETGEIESQLLQHASVRACAVVARQDAPGAEPSLVAYIVAQPDQSVAAPALRAFLGDRIPDYMVPSAFVAVQALPMTENGKLDRKALPAPARQRPELIQAYEEARTPSERTVCAAFARALNLDEVGRLDNFFELGGNSLRVHRVLADLQGTTGAKLSANLFFRQPTAAALAKALDEAQAAQNQAATSASHNDTAASHAHEPIALIAMAGRFPGAGSVEQFWDNLVAGRDTITVFDDSTLDAGVTAAMRADPDYVKARGIIDGVEDFDAAFFGINPKEAELMDPQQRLFLEICWECLERGGYAPDRTTAPVGVYGGMNNATYFQKHLSTRPDLVEAVGEFQVMLANEKDFIATRVAHRINLTGPAVSIHTACSTSLVAVHQAFQALRGGECHMALAGGVAIACPPRSGYLYQEGAMLSPDGHTRSFDARAQGTVFSDGAAVVLLKRLSDALADGDPIYAVLRGSAINNDGGAKASFTAPSVDGQAKVIGAALANAGVDARSIGYVETHGTATPMGDPVEIEGLTQAYRHHTQDTGFCRIGSVKSNVGHLIMAAGATGLIKTALSLHTEQLPASLHFESPNPAIDFDATPFRVHDRLSRWPRSGNGQPRRAGVSSFGVGGTNAHVIVEEAPLRAPSDTADGLHLLQLSARTPAALAAACERLANHLEAHPATSLADVAHTLRVGRTPFAQRACVVAGSIADAVQALRSADSPARTSAATGARVPQPVFMFPGQGAQYAGMGQALYASGRAHRAAFDECLQGFEGLLPFDLRERMFSPDPAALAPTSVTQPATFTLEYVLATQLLTLGVQPVALVGHSVGEFVAAVLAGVMSLRDAARLVARRGALMQALPAGTMLSVRLPADQLLARLPTTVSLAAENGPGACVAAGPTDEIEKLRAALESDGVVAKTLQTSHAFHSAMMEPAMAPFEALVREVELKAPQRPIYSTLTGRLLTAQEATDPHYWARHLREAVRFSPAVREILGALANPLFIELGPRNTLATLVRQHASKAQPANAMSMLADKPEEEERAWRLAAGRLWALGADIDLAPLDPRASKHRLCLPTYPFERKRLWVDIAAAATQPAAAAAVAPGPATAVLSVNPSTPATPEPPMTAAVPTDRRPALAQRLRTLFEDISGIELADAEGGMPFVEMGLDSLTLTQAALQVKKNFKVNLTFRQLMESYRSFDSLAAFVDANTPPDAVAAPAAVQPQAAPAAAVQAATPVVVNAVAAVPAVSFAAVPAAQGSLVQQVIAQQMQLMQQQLALLSGGGVAAAPVAVAAAQPAPQQQPATQPEPAAPAATAQAAPVAPEEGQGPLKYDVKKAFGAIARIHTQSKDITERQKARLAAFTRRYVDRTRKSKEFTAANRPHMADPRVVNGFRPITKEIVYQIVVDRTKGSRMWDLDGNEYVDVLNGFGMNLFGWQPDFVQEAVRKQLELGYEIGPQHPLAADVTKLICDLTGFDRAALCNTGSESVMAAVRIARTVTGRNTVVLFTGSYHGTFDEVLVRAGRNAKGMPAAPGIMSGMFGDVRVLEYGTPESLQFIRDNADDLAAVLVEVVQSRRPDFQPREWVREVRAITEKSGTCLIFDEVITGFRAHLRGVQAIFDVRADLACYGKVIGGGFPVGVIAGKREYMDALDGGGWQYGDDSVPTIGVTYFAGTFVRHPLALAACKASLLHLKESGEALQTQLNLHTAAMADELTAFCREVGAPIEIRYFASLWRVSWLEDHPLQDLLFAMMRSRGVHILDNFPCFMTTAHTHEDIARIKQAFKESVAEMQEAEFLPRLARSETAMDASRPPVPNARLGRDQDGRPAWFIPDPAAPGKFKRVEA